MHSTEQILATARVAPKHQRLVRRWLRGLERHGFITGDGAGYRCVKAVDRAAVDEAWREVDRLAAEVDYGAELIRYFRVATEHLPELMRDELDAVQLLFPEGRVDIHVAAYTDNFLSRYLNSVVTAALARLAEGHRGAEPLRILEVGAGVGGTSTEVIPALAGHHVEYVFTDVSQFFLNRAAERFGDHPWVRYGLFDFNADYRAQGYAANSFDVILCANVMHYARHAGRALERLRELLRPDGHLAFIETTRDNYQILTSMEFLFDATAGDFEDVRQGRDETFIDRESWLRLLDEAGARTLLCLPGEDDELSHIGMYAFVARVKDDRVPIDRSTLDDHLAERLPAYMIPSLVEVVDAIPLNANGKVDRAALGALSQGRARDPLAIDATAEPETETERRVAQVWAEVLRTDKIGRDQDFFSLGGDSLLAAQVVGHLLERLPEAGELTFDALLRELLEGTTVANLASRFDSSATDARDDEDGDLAALVPMGGDGNPPTRILVPDGTGSLDVYQHLVPGLGGDIWGLRLADPEGYLDVPAGDGLEHVAGQHADVLDRSGHDAPELVGYGHGGLVAVRIASLLAERGRPVGSVTVVAGCPPSYDIDDELLTEYLFLREAGADPQAAGYPPETALAAAVREVLRSSPGRVPDGALSELDGPGHADVAVAFAALGKRSRADRFADAVTETAIQVGPVVADLEARYALYRHTLRAVADHEPVAYVGDVTAVVPRDGGPLRPELADEMRGFWTGAVLGDLRFVEVPGDAVACLDRAYIVNEAGGAPR